MVLKIGKKIRDAREDLELSQEYVAELIPMTQSGYSKIERDVQEPSLEQLKRICEILKLSADSLLSINAYSKITEKDLELLKETKALIKKFN